jgi:hypothetical protein
MGETFGSTGDAGMIRLMTVGWTVSIDWRVERMIANLLRGERISLGT